MTWRQAASLAVALLCAGCSLKPPKDDAGRLAYEGVPNPWIVGHVQNEDGRYLEAFYDPRPLGAELCTAARIRIPIEVKRHALVREAELRRTVAFSPCENARAVQFGGLWPERDRLFSGEEMHAALLDVAAVIARGSHAVPGAIVDPKADACDLKSKIKLENFEQIYEFSPWIGQEDARLDIEFVEDKTKPEYSGAVIKMLFASFHVFFSEDRVTKIGIDLLNEENWHCRYAAMKKDAQ